MEKEFKIGDVVVWNGHSPVIGMVQGNGYCPFAGSVTVDLGGKHTSCGTGNYLRAATELEEKCFLIFSDFPNPVPVNYMALLR